MAGPWLYPISKGAEHKFTLSDGQKIPVSVDSYRELLGNGRITEDRYWEISANWRNIKIGDVLLIYTGNSDLGIIGYARVAGLKRHDDRWCIIPTFDLQRCEALLDNPVPASVVRKWVPPRRCVVNLAPYVKRLQKYLSLIDRIAEIAAALPEEIVEPNGLIEGSVRKIWIDSYERSPEARNQCIKFHGTKCCICECNLEALYEVIAAGYIHVHHLIPLSKIKGEYVVDPVKDLRPVCPNCHAILHLGGECRSIEEVKRMIEKNQKTRLGRRMISPMSRRRRGS